MHLPKISEKRTKANTLQILGDIYKNATTVGSKTKAKELKSRHGVKDKYQEYFIEKVNFYSADSYGTNTERQGRINTFLDSLPETVTNPVWRLDGESNSVYSVFGCLFLCRD